MPKGCMYHKLVYGSKISQDLKVELKWRGFLTYICQSDFTAFRERPVNTGTTVISKFKMNSRSILLPSTD